MQPPYSMAAGRESPRAPPAFTSVWDQSFPRACRFCEQDHGGNAIGGSETYCYGTHVDLAWCASRSRGPLWLQALAGVSAQRTPTSMEIDAVRVAVGVPGPTGTVSRSLLGSPSNCGAKLQREIAASRLPARIGAKAARRWRCAWRGNWRRPGPSWCSWMRISRIRGWPVNSASVCNMAGRRSCAARNRRGKC